MKTSLAICLGALEHLVSGSGDHFFDASPEVARLISQDAPWTVQDRPQVERGMQALLVGALDLAGLDRIELPAEFVAAAIALAVKPCNQLVACVWMSRAHSAAVMVAEEEQAHEPLSARQLFALVLSIPGACPLSQFESRWRSRVDGRVFGLVSEKPQTKVRTNAKA